MRQAIVVCAAALAAWGCASGPTPRETDGDFSLHSQDRAVTAVATGGATEGGLTGPQVGVTWTRDDVRGQAFGAPISLSVEEGSVDGVFGEWPVNLDVTSDDGELRVQGLFGGRLSDLRVSREEIEGTIGRCSYDLEAEGGKYAGFRACGRRTEQVTVRLPPAFSQMTPSRLAAALGVLLGIA